MPDGPLHRATEQAKGKLKILLRDGGSQHMTDPLDAAARELVDCIDAEITTIYVMNREPALAREGAVAKAREVLAREIARALEWAAEQALAPKHIGPFTWDASEQDRIAMYSNRTCEMIAAAIRRGPEEK